MSRSGKAGAAVAVVIACALAMQSHARADSPSEWMSYEEARLLGHPSVRDFQKPDGLPFCTSVNFAFRGVGPNDPPPPTTQATCFVRPEHQRIFLRRTQTYQVDVPTDGPSQGQGPHRHTGSTTNNFNFEGAQNLSEVSNPDVCHPVNTPGCYVSQHFYSRIALSTPANNAVEIGWIEGNTGPSSTGNNRYVFTTNYTPATGYSVAQHREWNLSVGGSYAFRVRQCAAPGIYNICHEFWDGSSWRVVRVFQNVMRCETPDGLGNCDANFAQEAYSTDLSRFFELNGGADGVPGLNMRNIQLQYNNSWQLFSWASFSGRWFEESPYILCGTSAYNNFKVYYLPPPSC